MERRADQQPRGKREGNGSVAQTRFHLFLFLAWSDEEGKGERIRPRADPFPKGSLKNTGLELSPSVRGEAG